jgi:hypothetical protein
VSGQRSAVIEWRRLILASELRPSARLIAFALSTHMDSDGGSCFPSLTRLQRETGLSRSGVILALAELERASLIERVRGGRGRPTRYRATSPLTGLPVVHSVDPTSALSGPEDVQEDAHNYSGRAHARRKKERGARAGSARPSKKSPPARTDGAHPDSSYLDEGAP